MYDVAHRANAAVSTASYALNGTRPVSRQTAERIWRAIEELGYRPNALARGLASKRSRDIALICPSHPSPSGGGPPGNAPDEPLPQGGRKCSE